MLLSTSEKGGSAGGIFLTALGEKVPSCCSRKWIETATVLPLDRPLQKCPSTLSLF